MTNQNYLYTDQFGERHNFEIYKGDRKYIIIASTGRSGSHFVGHTMYQTGLFGFPLEYANPRNLKEWKIKLNTVDIEDTIKKLKLIRTSSNGVFGIKIHYSQISEFGDIYTIKKLFPNAYFILLSRTDVLDQSISMTIARQTQQWISSQQGNNKKEKYSFKEINSNLKSIISDTSKWRFILNVSNVNFKELNFEEFLENPKRGIEKICYFAKIEISEALLVNTEKTKKQSNKINEEWRKKYLDDYSEKI